MTTFDEREKAHEKKFAIDEELRFKAESRRNKMIGEWAAGKLGITDQAGIDDYVKAVRRADLISKGDKDVFEKIKKDFAEKSVAVSDAELRKQMDTFLLQATDEVRAAGKS